MVAYHGSSGALILRDSHCFTSNTEDHVHMQIAFVAVALSLGLALVAGSLVLLHRRNRDVHQSLASDGHDRAHALNERADFLQEQLDRALRELPRLEQRIEQLQLERRVDEARLLVLEAERKGSIPTEASTRLSDQLVDMSSEAQQR